tara:strand:+ start:409 stop:690 length:282 start_codon:yes stop_codon:yes gene_type:complete
MQKNIVFGVNEAMAAEGPTEKKKQPPTPARSDDFTMIKEEIVLLREENLQFAAAVTDLRAANDDLRSKIEELLSHGAQKSKKKKANNQKMNKR